MNVEITGTSGYLGGLPAKSLIGMTDSVGVKRNTD